MPQKRIVQGEIDLPSDVPGGPADVVVEVEDISRSDAPSQVVAAQRLRRSHLQPGGVLPFKVEVPADRVDERRLYSVRVHVDRSGSGEVEKGDLISTQTYPVLTRGHGNEARVKVRSV